MKIQYLQAAPLSGSQGQQKPCVFEEYSPTIRTSSVKAGWVNIVSGSAFLKLPAVQKKVRLQLTVLPRWLVS